MAKNDLSAGSKQISVKVWPINTEKNDSALIGGVANGKPTSRTAPKSGK